MGKALYRHYRPKKLSEVIGQAHVTDALTAALKSGAVSHAYLFTGPRGVGKTSIARILAHDLNDLPYVSDDDTHLDIIEIDAASNRRIDDIRDLRDKVHVAPTSSKYKVYIIDEVHMLTGESFNALLKTLEEPPAHVIFILATTEAHKLPATIISRTQRFTFRPVEKQIVHDYLRSIADKEKIEIDDDALEVIAEHGEGSIRDSVNLLDQARNQADKVITAGHIRTLLGLPESQLLDGILAAVVSGDAASVIVALSDLQLQGVDPARLSSLLAKIIREGLLDGTLKLEQSRAIELLTRLLDVPASSRPFRLLELILLQASVISVSAPTKPRSKSPDSTVKEPLTLRQDKDASRKQEPAKKTEMPSKVDSSNVLESGEPKEAVTEPKPKNAIATGEIDPSIWPEVLGIIKKDHNTLYGIARMAHVSRIENGLQLGFQFAFHQKRVNEAKNRAVIAAAIEQITGLSAQLECVLREDMTGEPEPAAADDTVEAVESEIAGENEKPGIAQSISNIFGGGEVLES